MPSIELDDGSVLAETVAICEYLEDTQPSLALIGSTPEEKSRNPHMWQRRIEIQITEHMYKRLPAMPRGWTCLRTGCTACPKPAAGLKAIVQGKARLAGWPDGGQTVHRG